MNITAAIDRFAAGAEIPGKGIKGLSRQDLLAFPVPGTWSIQQIVVHLMDSDLVACDRIKRIACMNRPLLIGYDENAFIKNLSPEKLDAAECCEAFRLNRKLCADVLRTLPEAAFERWGVHNENGKMTLSGMVVGYSDHLDHHMKFLYEKRAKLGKPL